jgi:hypothetical protein
MRKGPDILVALPCAVAYPIIPVSCGVPFMTKQQCCNAVWRWRGVTVCREIGPPGTARMAWCATIAVEDRNT